MHVFISWEVLEKKSSDKNTLKLDTWVTQTTRLEGPCLSH